MLSQAIDRLSDGMAEALIEPDPRKPIDPEDVKADILRMRPGDIEGLMREFGREQVIAVLSEFTRGREF
jgi:hypothetical protein